MALNSNGSVELDAQQKERLLELWEEEIYDAKALTEALFPGCDGRSKEGLAVKTFLGSKGLKPKMAHEYEKKTDSFVLSDDDKQFIESYAGSHRPLEIARLMYHNDKMTNLAVEARAVLIYYNTLDPKAKFLQADEEGGSEMSEYKPPRNVREAITKVKKYIFVEIDDAKLSQKRRDELLFLVKFMNTHRYVFSMNRLTSERDRTLYESSFVRFVHDKADLTEEDVDLYINLCDDIVSKSHMEDEELLIKKMMFEDEDNKKLSTAMVDHLSELRKDKGVNINRQKKTLEDLNRKRSDRIDGRKQENASVLNLVEAWKLKESRDLLAKNAMRQKELLKKEIERLSTMDSVMFEIFGVGKDEVL